MAATLVSLMGQTYAFNCPPDWGGALPLQPDSARMLREEVTGEDVSEVGFIPSSHIYGSRTSSHVYVPKPACITFHMRHVTSMEWLHTLQW